MEDKCGVCGEILDYEQYLICYKCQEVLLTSLDAKISDLVKE